MNAAPDAPPLPDAVPAWRSRRAWAVLLVVALLGLGSDLASKWAAFRFIADAPVVVDRRQVLATRYPGDVLPPHDPVVVVPRVLNFTLVLNPGAVFGMGAGQRWFFVGFTVVALGAGLWVFGTWTHGRQHAMHAGLGLLISGGVGNLYDRMVYGCVRDFIHPLPGVRLPGGLTWPGGGREIWPYVSNVADLWLIVGMLMLLWFGRRSLSSPGR